MAADWANVATGMVLVTSPAPMATTVGNSLPSMLSILGRLPCGCVGRSKSRAILFRVSVRVRVRVGFGSC